MEQQNINMIYSCVLSRGGKKIVRVTFKREDDIAEGVVPDGIVETYHGFTKEEVLQLEKYLTQHRVDIFQKAKEITGITHWF